MFATINMLIASGLLLFIIGSLGLFLKDRSLVDKILVLQCLGTCSTAFLLVWAMAFGQASVLYIALLFALMSSIAAAAFVKFHSNSKVFAVSVTKQHS